MATSGTTTYSLTSRQVIDYALHKLRVLGANETATAEQATGALRELNVLLKEWMKYPNLWRETEASVTLVASTYSYTLSPVPHRVVSVRYRDSGSRDTPMRPLSREEYYNFPKKDSVGIPTQYYVDYQRSAATLKLWQSLSSVTTETLPYTYLRKFEDVAALDDDIDIRQEHLGMAGYSLAARLADDYGREGEVTNRVILRAEEMREELLDSDREDEVRFVAGW